MIVDKILPHRAEQVEICVSDTLGVDPYSSKFIKNGYIRATWD